MRILWLSHLIPYPPKGGVLQRSYYLLRELAKYHEVDLLAFNQKNLIEPLFASLEEGVSAADRELKSFCRRVEFFPIASDERALGSYLLAARSLLSKDPYNINWLKSITFEKRVREYVSKHDYALVHFDTISLIPFIRAIGNLPTVLDHHNIESHMLLRRAENESSRFKSWYYYQEGKRLESYEQRLCPGFDLNITCSEMDKERLLRIAPDCHAEVVPNGVDVNYFRSTASEVDGKRLVFMGTLSWYPNREAVLFIANELWPKLKESIPDIRFDIIGANPPKQLLDLACTDDHFVVHGFVDDPRPLISAAAVFICPIRDGGGTKLKILDAFAMGKAVVANPVACEGINVDNGNNVIFANDVSEYTAQIKRLVEDSAYRKQIGLAARSLVEREYSYSSIGKKLSQLFEEIVITSDSPDLTH